MYCSVFVSSSHVFGFFTFKIPDTFNSRTRSMTLPLAIATIICDHFLAVFLTNLPHCVCYSSLVFETNLQPFWRTSRNFPFGRLVFRQ